MLLSKSAEENLTRMDREYQMYAMGVVRGEAREKRKVKEEMIPRMNALNIPIDVISNAAEMPIEEVQAIINSRVK